MSDASVAAALRSSARLVVVEAPGGCGKTYQGAEFAREAVPTMDGGRLLILTHTNAACDVFAARIKGIGRAAEIRTIHGLITEIASAYHKTLGLPADVGAWARRQNSYDELAAKVAELVRKNIYIAASLARRFPLIICDEHQDASADQHAIIMSVLEAGSHLRIFGDPMQQIFGEHERGDAFTTAESRWTALKKSACRFEELDFPHRWKNGEPELGRWILEARSTLKSGGQIDLTARPPRGLTIHFAENTPQNPRGFYVTPFAAKPIYERGRAGKMLILSGTNDHCMALRGFFKRSFPLWEGHVRDNLADLIAHSRDHAGAPEELAKGVLKFLGSVASGFTPSDQGKVLIAEAASGCTGRRKLKPAMIQSMAKHLVDQPDHKGVGNALARLREFIGAEQAFSDVHVHRPRELAEAIQLSSFDDLDYGFAEISRRRTHARPKVPDRAISTIHKAKGLEFDNVLLLPCDRSTFSSSLRARAKLYVAMSRARKSLMLVVSRTKPSPLFRI